MVIQRLRAAESKLPGAGDPDLGNLRTAQPILPEESVRAYHTCQQAKPHANKIPTSQNVWHERLTHHDDHYRKHVQEANQ